MVSSAVANSRLAPRLHLLVSIDQKVVEILNANGPEQWIFHVGMTPQPAATYSIGQVAGVSTANADTGSKDQVLKS
jgi:hypothetical protein